MDDEMRPDPTAMTQKELLIALHTKVDLLAEAFNAERVLVAIELGKRPTRAESYTLAMVLGTIVGAIVGNL